jgi:hypothetical protein
MGKNWSTWRKTSVFKKKEREREIQLMELLYALKQVYLNKCFSLQFHPITQISVSQLFDNTLQPLHLNYVM